jgi:protein-S-isoprenylcysteine O-methyltransferase Ste14
VDVQAIREHMNSFRNVASTSLEHALASHRIRQAKGKVAGRTTLVAGLSVVSVLAIATNSAMKIYFPSLGWLMGLIVCLAIAELILRVEAIRRHRRELRYRILDPAKKAGERNDKVDVDGVASAEEAGMTLS